MVARHPGCPEGTLKTIAHDPAWQITSGLFDNPNTPVHIIENLLELEGPEDLDAIRCLSRPQISKEILHQLAFHPRPEVRLSLARHPAVIRNILGLLATDGIKEIRRLAAAHPETDPAVLGRLVRAGSTPNLMGLSEPDTSMPVTEIRTLLDWGVWARQLAVRHPNTDAATAARLLCDREPKIREWAAVHPSLSSETKRDLIRAGSGNDFQGIMPPDPSLPPETLFRISKLGSWGEWVVANNPYVPSALLDSLGRSEDWQVRLFVAKNPSASSSILKALENDPVEKVRMAVYAIRHKDVEGSKQIPTTSSNSFN